MGYKHKPAGVFSCNLSDHFPIFSFIVGPVNLKLSSNNAAETFRRIDNSSIELFHSKVSNISWEPVVTEREPKKSYGIFLDLLQKCYEESFPWQEFKKI